MKCEMHSEKNCDKCTRRKMCMNCLKPTERFVRGTWLCKPCEEKKEKIRPIARVCKKCGADITGKINCPCTTKKTTDKNILSLIS